MNRIYICGLAQELGPYDRTPWMQVYFAHDIRRRAEDWIMAEVEESGIPGQDDGEDGEEIDKEERQYFENLNRRSFYFVQEKGINTAHKVTWRLMPDRTWKRIDD